MHLRFVANPGRFNFLQAFACGLAFATLLAADSTAAQDKASDDPIEEKPALIQSGLVKSNPVAMNTPRSILDGDSSIAFGRVFGWPDSGFAFVFDNFVKASSEIVGWWSINVQHLSLGWFYAFNFPAVEITHLPDVDQISEIEDASALDYSKDWSVGPVGVGDFVVMRNLSTGFYAAFRVDDIPSSGPLVANVTWYLQEDGSASFGSHIFFENFESGDTTFWSKTIP